MDKTTPFSRLKPQFTLIKTGTGDCDSIPYIDHWDPDLQSELAFPNFELARQALCLLIKDELELLSEKYDRDLKDFQEKQFVLGQASSTFFLSTRGSHTAKKLYRMYDYYEVAKEAKSFEELNFKFYVLSSELAQVLSIHFEIIEKVELRVDGSKCEIFFLRHPERDYFAIEKTFQGPQLVGEERLGKLLRELDYQRSVLFNFYEKIKTDEEK